MKTQLNIKPCQKAKNSSTKNDNVTKKNTLNFSEKKNEESEINFKESTINVDNSLNNTKNSPVPSNSNSSKKHSEPKECSKSFFAPAKTISEIDSGLKSCSLTARVCSKLIQRQFKSGLGKYISVNVKDQTGEAKILVFNETISLHENFLKKFNRLIRISNASIRAKILEENDSNEILIPKQTFNFTKLKDLQSIPIGSEIDIFVGVKTALKKSVQTIFKDQLTDLVEMIIADNSADSVNFSLWMKENQDDVIHYYQTSKAAIFPKVKVSGYNGRSISSNSKTEGFDINEIDISHLNYNEFISNFVEMKKEKEKEVENASSDESLKRNLNSSFSEEENVKKAKKND
ncbi:unnamed protein product [Brachionus calyciflorus]|uniref:Replication protein A OB domain-containing protein n=1 Tax=Brachionus calyciflorus TaxID=104777 RepID=A0A814JB45_9BILA|nr:unnamed protein product [Brachionus calyciflorus]